jgi:hypothetical protein
VAPTGLLGVIRVVNTRVKERGGGGPEGRRVGDVAGLFSGVCPLALGPVPIVFERRSLRETGGGDAPLSSARSKLRIEGPINESSGMLTDERLLCGFFRHDGGG